VPGTDFKSGSELLEADAEPGHVDGFGEGAAPADGSGVIEGVYGYRPEQHRHWNLCGGVSPGLCERRFVGCWRDTFGLHFQNQRQDDPAP